MSFTICYWTVDQRRRFEGSAYIIVIITSLLHTTLIDTNHTYKINFNKSTIIETVFI